MGKSFDTRFDGSNLLGYFAEDTYRIENEIYHVLEQAPRHQIGCYWNITDLYNGDYMEIKKALDSEDIDILTADLDDEDTIKKIIEVLTFGDGNDFVLMCLIDHYDIANIQSQIREIYGYEDY
jgi:hypothetical protein